ncbi:hypothetical protein QBC44DRAFT_272154 [Cladorrhinum sp. PSN332]|nr:hypothetical protein QBC44DRAFT_272154 [Cladorrhinum sp. PSN332]
MSGRSGRTHSYVEDDPTPEANFNNTANPLPDTSTRPNSMRATQAHTVPRPANPREIPYYYQANQGSQHDGALVPYNNLLDSNPFSPSAALSTHAQLLTRPGQLSPSDLPPPQPPAANSAVNNNHHAPVNHANQPSPGDPAQPKTSDHAVPSHPTPPNWLGGPVNHGYYHYQVPYLGLPGQPPFNYYYPHGYPNQVPFNPPRAYSDPPSSHGGLKVSGFQGVPSTFSDDQASNSNNSGFGSTNSVMAAKRVDAIHNPSEAYKDITIKLELPVEEHWGPDVEELSRLSRLGRFKDAQEHFQTKLEHVSTKVPYVSIQYVDMLLESGDLEAFRDYDLLAGTGFPTHAKPWLKTDTQDKSRSILETNVYLLSTISGPLSRPSINDLLEIMTELSAWGLAGSTEIQIFCICLRLLYIHDSSDTVANTAMGLFDLKALYANLCSENRIWDFRDLFFRLARVFGIYAASELLFSTNNLSEVLDKISTDWNSARYDESICLGLLDLYTSIILDNYNHSDSSVGEVSREPQGKALLLLQHASLQAEKIQRGSPEYMKSRPFVRWLLAKYMTRMGSAPRRPDGTGLGQIPGLLFQDEAGINLPVFVPVEHASRPSWDHFYVRSDPAERYSVEVSLQTAIELGDYKLQEVSLQLLILQSSNPRQMMNALAALQESPMGSRDACLRTYLCKYLVTSGPDSAELIRALRKYSIRASPDYRWASSVLEGFLSTAEDYRAEDSSGVALTDPLALCRRELKENGSQLPEYITTFIREKLKIRVPMRLKEQGLQTPKQSSSQPPAPPRPRPPELQKKQQRQNPSIAQMKHNKKPRKSRAKVHVSKQSTQTKIITAPSAESATERERLRNRFRRQSKDTSPQPILRPTWEYYLRNHMAQSPSATKTSAPRRTASGDWKVEGWSDNWREDVEYHNQMRFKKVAGWPATWREDLARMYGYGANDTGLGETQDRVEEAGGDTAEYDQGYADYEEDEGGEDGEDGEDEGGEDGEDYGSDYDEDDDTDDDDYNGNSGNNKESSDPESGTESGTESETDGDGNNAEELNGSVIESDHISPSVKFSRGLPKLDFPQTLLEDHTMTVIIKNRHDPAQSRTFVVEKGGVVERSTSGSEINASTILSSAPTPSVTGGYSSRTAYGVETGFHGASIRGGESKQRSLGNGLAEQILKRENSSGAEQSSGEDEWKGADEVIFQGRRRGGHGSSTSSNSTPRVPPAGILKDPTAKAKGKAAVVEDAPEEEELLIIL